MATRIFIRCKTQEMPGPPDEKNSRMANAACQKIWNRDFNESDRLTTFGGDFNSRCMLLIDSGPVDAKEYNIVQLRWKGQMLVVEPGPVHPRILKEFRTNYQFNPANRPIPTVYTDDELKEVVSPELYKKHIQAREEQIARGRGEDSQAM